MSLEIGNEKKALIPTLSWYQIKDYIILSFEVYNSIEQKISIDNNNIFFNVLSNGNEYLMDFELLNEINKDDSNYIIDEKTVKMVLKKKDENRWNTLTKDKSIYKNNIKINWNRWINDSDDEEDETTGGNQQFDFQQMMQNMGGMGNMEEMMKNMGNMGNMEEMMQKMGNMGGFDDNDEDNEDENEEENEEECSDNEEENEELDNDECCNELDNDECSNELDNEECCNEEE
jgi:hypothetical protein